MSCSLFYIQVVPLLELEDPWFHQNRIFKVFKHIHGLVMTPLETHNVDSTPKGYIRPPTTVSNHSGLPSERINLSPFTKDFRGGGHSNESALNLLLPSLRACLLKT